MGRGFKIGDRVASPWLKHGTVSNVDNGSWIEVLWDGELSRIPADDLKLLEGGELSLTDEVQDLINVLVSTGNDNKRLLSRKVAALLGGSRGVLSRGDKMQAAAMLLVSAGLAADQVPERDDG